MAAATMSKIQCLVTSLFLIFVLRRCQGKSSATNERVARTHRQRGTQHASSSTLQFPPPPLATPLCNETLISFRDAAQLACIVTGMENSGTSIMSRLIMSVDGLMSAFECGILLSGTPLQFQDVDPFYDWLIAPTQDMHWGLTEEQRKDLVESTCHAEMYAKLRAHSPVFKRNPGSRILDKTPRYVYNLTSIMKRAPGVPVIVTVKPHEDQVAAWTKRGTTRQEAEIAIQAATHEMHEAARLFPERVLIVNMSQFKQDTDAIMTRVFDFLNMKWDSSYVSLDNYKQKGSRLGWKPSVEPFNQKRLSSSST